MPFLMSTQLFPYFSASLLLKIRNDESKFAELIQELKKENRSKRSMRGWETRKKKLLKKLLCKLIK